MAASKRWSRRELQRRLLGATAKLPTSPIGRVGQAGRAALRAARLVRSRDEGDEAVRLDAIAAMVGPLGNLKGVAMKMGQLMSYLELQLPSEVQAAFSVLQTHSPSMPFARVADVIERELGERAAPLLYRMTREPAAAASIGQVHRAVLPDGSAVAVKVQYPEVERAIDSDFHSAAVGTSFARLVAPSARVEAVIAGVRRALLEECDYLREASYQERFASLYREHPTISVPAVHRAYCSRRVLTTTWSEGSALDELLESDPPQADRDRLGTALFEFYVGTLFRHGLYNWDPHPGNYLFAPGGRLVMLDHGSTREFEPELLRKLAALTYAVHLDAPNELHRAFVDLGLVRAETSYDFETVRSFVRSFYGPTLRDEVLRIEPGEARPFKTLIADKRKLLRLQMPDQLVFILRIRFGLMAVLSRLGARANWYRLERDFASAVP